MAPPNSSVIFSSEVGDSNADMKRLAVFVCWLFGRLIDH
jgi:hypothetical protein